MKKEKQAWMSLCKILLVCSLFCVFLLYGNTERAEGASYTSNYYDGVGAVNTWAYDTTTGTGTGLKGDWPEGALAQDNDNGYNCNYMYRQGWSDPESWELCQNGTGTWISFKDPSGDWYYLKNVWMQIGGNWFFSDYNGYLVKGWAFIPKNAYQTELGLNCGWFYFDENGVMQQGWQNIGGNWYYFFITDASGADPLYEGGECLYDTTGVASLNTVGNSTYSRTVNQSGYNYTKTARYVTGFSFQKNIYVEGDNGYFLESAETINVSLGENDSCSKSVTAPTKTGYHLNTTLSSPGAVTNSLQLINDDTLSGALTKTDINWYYDRSSYILYLNANGGTLPTQFDNVTLKYLTGSYNDLSWNIPSRAGYSFNGWWTSTSRGVQVYGPDGKVKNEGTYWSEGRSVYAREHTLYAQWNAKTYTVNYNANGGTLTSGNAKATVTYGGAVSLAPKASKDGILFAGWGLSPSDKQPLSSLTMPASDITLYALYSQPVSDMKEAVLVAWSTRNPSVYNSFPMTLTWTDNGKFTYSLNDINLRSGLTYANDSEIQVSIILYDNALNRRVYGAPNPPDPKPFPQTVEHYLWNMEINDWSFYTSTSEQAFENSIYTPKYLDKAKIPAGYYAHSIDASYKVTGPTTTRAYYMPTPYKLTFDKNAEDAICDTESKTVYKDWIYGELPVPTREGYEFLGWYTDAKKGTLIDSNDRYPYAGDSTVYAHWEPEKFRVVYDYLTNGGNAADVSYKDVSYKTAVDLTMKAYKTDWEFIGWNTNPKATTAMSSASSWQCETCGKAHTMSSMPSHDIVLYAIFKKDITLTIIEQAESGQTTRTKTQTIYNTDVDTEFAMTEEPVWNGWCFLGWTEGQMATDDVMVGVGTSYITGKNSTLYGLYTSDVTISYDTNRSAMEIDAQTKERYYNASADFAYPEFVIADGPQLSQHSFVKWNVSGGSILDTAGNKITSCVPKETVFVKSDIVLTAQWDQYPEIEAYDRYFTLEEAQNGEITEEALLEKVKGTDLEDGTLVNGTDVVVKDCDASKFTALDTDIEVKITYQATDSFGNDVTKTVTVTVTDTSMKKSTRKKYVRFISSEFFEDTKGNLVDVSAGGLEENSKWRKESGLYQLLKDVLSNKKTNVEVWSFSQEELKKMKKDL